MAAPLDLSDFLAIAEPPLFDFLFDLLVDPDYVPWLPWRYAWPEGNRFPLERSALDEQAHEWAADEDLPWPERAQLLLQLDNLPWENDRVVFYWGDDW